jgi:hypothetical protein
LPHAPAKKNIARLTMQSSGASDSDATKETSHKRTDKETAMFIARRHPTMKNALRNESGVFGTYAASTIAVVVSSVSVAFFAGTLVGRQPAPTTFVPSAEAGAVWVDVGTPDLPADAAPVTFEKSGLEIVAANLSTDQPVYDEAAAVLIYTR